MDFSSLSAASFGPPPPSTCSTLLHNIGLHAKDDLAILRTCESPAQCCAFCYETSGCVGWTLNAGSICRSKGPSALEKSSRVSCSDCVSGFLDNLKPTAPPTLPPTYPVPSGGSSKNKNVLLIVVDDLRPQMGGSYGQNYTMTPNIDAFAKTATTFTRAYCQQAVCSPSRNSFMSGRRPDTTKAWNFKTDFRAPGVGADWLTMPEYFKVHGWRTAGTGKVYHPGLPKNNDPLSWSEPYNNTGQNNLGCREKCPPEGAPWCGNSWCSLNKTATSAKGFVDWEQWIHDDAVRLLDDAVAEGASDSRPFFIAVGFHKPHTPYAYLSEYDALYPPAEEIASPSGAAKVAPIGMPDVAWEACSAITPFNFTTPMPTLQAQLHRRAYYAAVSQTDRHIGSLLSHLDQVGETETTAVIVFGDHGYELGEHNLWCKKNNFELGVRVPFILRAPWITASRGAQTGVLAELVDVYPTLVELAGLPPPTNVGLVGTPAPQGVSLVPALRDPTGTRTTTTLKPYAFSQYPRCGGSAKLNQGDCLQVPALNFSAMGYSLRTAEWRYTEWKKWDGATLTPLWGDSLGVELYDHRGDDGMDFEAWENVNLAAVPEWSKIAANLSAALAKQFQRSKKE